MFIDHRRCQESCKERGPGLGAFAGRADGRRVARGRPDRRRDRGAQPPIGNSRQSPRSARGAGAETRCECGSGSRRDSGSDGGKIAGCGSCFDWVRARVVGGQVKGRAGNGEAGSCETACGRCRRGREHRRRLRCAARCTHVPAASAPARRRGMDARRRGGGAGAWR
jgi:hypothetical protein